MHYVEPSAINLKDHCTLQVTNPPQKKMQIMKYLKRQVKHYSDRLIALYA